MIRNALAYHLPDGWPWNAVETSEYLSRRTFQPCGNLDAESSGFVPPREDADLCHAVGHHLVCCLQTEERLLPAYVVAEYAELRAEEIEQQQGYQLGRKQLKDLKEQVTQELLPQAFTRKRRTLAWIDRVAGLLVIDAPSANRAEDVLEAMRRAFDVLPVSLLRTERAPAGAMADWLAAGEAPDDFTIDQDLELVAVTEDAAAVRYTRHDLHGDDVRQHLEAGKLPSMLALTHDDRVSFILTDKLEVKRILLLDILTAGREQADDAAAQFDADFLLCASEVAGIYGALIPALGGLMEQRRDDLVDQAAADARKTFGRLADSVTADGGSMTISIGDRVIVGAGNEHDPIYAEAVSLVKISGRPSISMIQRHFGIGYNRAARLIEQMERDGIVSAMNSNGTREVLAA